MIDSTKAHKVLASLLNGSREKHMVMAMGLYTVRAANRRGYEG